MPAIAFAFSDSRIVTESIQVEVLRSLALPDSFTVLSSVTIVVSASVDATESEVDNVMTLPGERVSTADPVSVTVFTAIRTVVSVSIAVAPASLTVLA